MSIQLQAIRLFFISGFLMSILGSTIGIIRLLSICRVFELLKPELKQFSANALNSVKRSFCRPKHWITMTREMLSLNKSAYQVSLTKGLGAMPLVSIKANSFFKPSFWTIFIPLKSANRLRDQMQTEILKLSTNCVELKANKSDHFVWVDQPDVIVDAVKIILDKVGPSHLRS